MKKIEYRVTLKNGKIIKFWFLGSQLEKVLKEYNIPFTKVVVK